MWRLWYEAIPIDSEKINVKMGQQNIFDNGEDNSVDIGS